MAVQGGLVGLADGTAGATQNAQALAASKAAAQSQQASASAAYNNPAYQSAVSTTEADIADNNFSGAWSSALSTSGLFGTNYNSATTDPLLQAMESSSGLSQLDPSKQWTSAQDTAFYNALGSNPVYNGKTTTGLNGTTESLGKNPYGLWGSGSALTNGTDAKANQSQAGNDPNVEQFAGATPSKSFLSKYGADIGALALTAVSFGVAAPALAGALAADGIASGLAAGAIAGGVMGAVNTVGVDAITGKPITAGGVLGGALGGAAGGGLVPLAGGAINGATGLGSTLSTGLAGAGIGAARSALTGGNIGLGALTGGVAGAVQGSNVLGNIKSGAVSATGSNIAGSLANAGTNYAIGGATGLAAGALMGRPGNSGVSSTPTSNSGVAPIGGGSTLGNISGMSSTPTSTDTSLASTITGALPGLLQTGAGVGGAVAAGNALSNANQNVITTQQNNLGNINNIWATQQQTGQGANTALQSSLGLNGQTANPSNFENMPGYQFAVSQGTQAIQRQAAAMGNAYTPNTAAAVGQYVTGTASQDYNTYISQLMGAAGLGTTANQGLQTANQNTANNISTAQQNIGAAQSGEYTSLANSAGSLFGTNGAGTGLLNGVLGGSSGGVNSSGVPQGGGTVASNAADPFAGTSLANNQNAINTYNADNGPTSADISADTSGMVDTNYMNGVSPTLDTGSMGFGDGASYYGGGATDFLGDL